MLRLRAELWFTSRKLSTLKHPSRLHGSASSCNGHQGLDKKQAFLDNRINTKLWKHNYMSIINLCTIFGNDQFSVTSRHVRVLSRRCTCLNHNPSMPSFLNLAPFHNPQLERLDRRWWLMAQRSAFWVCRSHENTFRGSMTPKTVEFFDSVGMSQLKR